MDERIIAKNIRKLRLDQGMSISRLAESSGLTKGYISKIEHSEKAPPLSTLSKIANALNVDVGLLTADEMDLPEDIRICITKSGFGKELSSGSLEGYHYQALAYRKSGKNMEPFLLQPTFDEKAIFSHEGEEFMYTIEGIHEFMYGDQSYALHEGDSVYFDSIVPHSGRSIGDKKAKVLAVMYSYKRNSFDTVQERLSSKRGKNS